MAVDVVVYDKVDKESEKIQDALYALYPQQTITDAAIASFADGSDSIPVKELVVAIEPVQDLHGYDSPWPAGGGANIWDEQWELGSFDSSGNPSVSSSSIRCKNFIPVTPGNTYLYFNASASSQAPWLYDANKEFIQRYGSYMASGTTITIPEGCYYIKFALPGSYGATYKNDVAWNYPATVTTYSPYSNICPISGWTGAEIEGTGKNLCEGSQNFVIGIDAEKATVLNTSGTCLVAHVVEGETYTFSNADINRRVVTYWDEMPTVNAFTRTVQSLTGSTFTAIKSGLVLIYIYNAVVSAETAQIELSSTATAYEPFQSKEISVTFPSEAGTVYGGTLTVNPDRTGQLVVDRAGVDMASITDWNVDRDAKRVYKVRSDLAPASGSNVIADGLICNRFPSVTANQIYANVEGVAISTESALQFRINGLTDDANVTLAMVNEYFSNNSTIVVAKLATPITYTLTASEIDGILSTIYGTNNIWADCGDIEKLTYRADLGKYIDSHITTAVANALNA